MSPTLLHRPSRRDFLRALALGGTFACCNVRCLSAAEAKPEPGGSLLHNAAAWAKFRAEMARRKDSQTLLAADSDKCLQGELLTIVHKKHAPPSGDPHDYLSLAPYSWPDPKKPDGLPYLNRDGEVNPEFYEYDNPKLEELCHAVPWLGLRAEADGSAPHARRAGKLLRAWFLDADTRMNPHLRFAQIKPGIHNGSSSGIIDTTSFVFLIDAISHLPFSDDWTPAHLAGVKAWFGQYLDWLLTSEPGRKEGAATNNHGTWYDAQVAAFAWFCERPEVARKQIEKTTAQRIGSQIEPDGQQPAELRRTLALTYCTYNLLGFACVAQVAAKLGIDLWHWEVPEGRSLLTALRWLAPYYAKEKPWAHKQIKPFDFTNAALVLNFAWQRTGDDSFAKLCDQVEQHPWQRLTFSKASLAVRKPGAPK